MSLESFGEELRRHREQKQISLAAISEATRISEKMLAAIEAGNFSLLPQAYIRAFIRAYAHAVDLKPDEILRKYDAVNQEIRSAAEEWVNRSKTHMIRAERTPTEEPSSSARFPLPSIIAGALVIAGIAAVLYFSNREPAAPPQEPLANLPFDKAIHESDATPVQQPEPTPAPVTPVRRPVADSLRLEITTTDSVWVSITIDNIRKGQYLFPPGRVRTWAGKEQFVVSMGNAGVATFKLNGSKLGALGKRGAIARNVLITQSGIQPAQ